MNQSPIKYRGKTKDNKGTWVFGSLVITAVGTSYIGPQNQISPSFELIVVDKKSVGRYIGIKDRYGKDIYEGHQVQYTRMVYADCSRTKVASIGESIIGEIYFSEGIWLGIRCKDGTGRLLLPGTIHTKGPNSGIEIIGDSQDQREQEAI